jgi:hypothetical protein
VLELGSLEKKKGKTKMIKYEGGQLGVVFASWRGQTQNCNVVEQPLICFEK